MLGIIILNYNCWDLNVSCIQSIKKCTNIKYKIYLIDNASSIPPSSKFLRFIKDCSDVVFIRNRVNKGYAAGNNIGYKRALEDGCTEILITNNDVIFGDKCLDMLQSALRNNPQIGIIGPKVYLPNGELQEINMGCKMTLRGKYIYMLRKTPLKKFSEKFVRTFHASDQDKNKPFYVYGVSGCCFMISSECIEQLYPLDENTFLYEEENILAYQIERLGKKEVYYSPATIIHLGGESTKNLSTFSYGCQVESEIYYCKKYLNTRTVALLPFILIRSVVYIKRYGVKDIDQYCKKIIKMLRNMKEGKG